MRSKKSCFANFLLLPSEFLFLRRWRRVRSLRQFLTFVDDPALGAEALVVGVLHDLADLHVPQLEVQRIVDVGISREPVLAVNLFAIGGELGKQVLAAAFANIRDVFSVGLYDLKILGVDPD